MSLKYFRIKLIRFFIEINENLFFYPRLKKAYNEMFSQLPLKTAVDVGVNRGQTIDFFKKINKDVEIIGFEPNKDLYEMIVNMEIPNLTIFNYGCSNISGQLMFHENILDESSTFEQTNSNSKWLLKKAKILGVNPDKLINNSYKVKVVQLSDFLNSNLNFQKVDILKIDVEGHEMNVLKGLFSEILITHIRFIQVEVHDDDMYFGNKKSDIFEILNSNNFVLFKEVKHGFGSFSDLIFKQKAE